MTTLSWGMVQLTATLPQALEASRLVGAESDVAVTVLESWLRPASFLAWTA